jgi:two-component system response regulator NreC
MRSGLKVMLSHQEDIQVVGEAADGLEALGLIESVTPDVMLLDISMAGMSGLDCLKKIKDQYPRVKVILLTMYEDPQYLREGLANGAMGYVVKKVADDVLYKAIRTVFAGDVFLQPDMARALAAQFPERHMEQRPDFTKPLSEQEMRVLKFIAMGYANAEIAEKINIKVKTVETYKYRIMEKLNVTKRSELVKYAVKNGLMQDE